MEYEITNTKIIRILKEDTESWSGSYEIKALLKRKDGAVDVTFQYSTDRDLFVAQLKSWDLYKNFYSINSDGSLHLIILGQNDVNILDLLVESLSGDFKMKEGK
jgi:hypothetical protein